MIRVVTVAVLLFIFSCQNLNAQNASKLTVPNSPAFSILNFEPASVMRPSNAKELAADVLNSFDKDGKLLLNLGLEVTPYWLKSHPDLKRQTYLNPNTGQSFLQSFSLSAATVKDSSTGNNKLGAGFRFKLYNGHPVDALATADAQLKLQQSVIDILNTARSFAGDEIKSKQDAIDFLSTNLQRAAPEVAGEMKTQAILIAANYKDSSAGDIRLFLDKLINDREEHYSELAETVSDLLYQRKGFILEFAGATGFNASKNKSLERSGFWGNASYYVSPDDLFTLTARFMNRNNDTSQTNFDLGIGFLKRKGTYNISVEGMFRWYRAEIPDVNINNQPIIRLEKDFTYRLAIQSSYLISKEVSVNLSLGKDFDSPFISGSGFFSILGINYSIFNKQVSKLPMQ